VGKTTGLESGQMLACANLRAFSMEELDQAVMDFLAGTEVGKSPPKLVEGPKLEEDGQLYTCSDQG